MGLKIFLSYGHDANTDLVLRIKRDLEAAGHHPWIDTNEIKTGDHWRRAIIDGLSDTHCTLAFLSRHAVRENGVCLDEIALAMGIQHGNLATILVEPEDHVQPPVSVSHIQWLDMSNWATQAKDDAWYQQKLHAILNLLADPETHRFRGEIEELAGLLHPITQAADIPPLIEGFVGREWVVERVETWRRNEPQRRVFRLTGGPGAGKSAFAAWMTHYQRANVVGLNLCKWNDEDRSDPPQVLRTLAFLIAMRLPCARPRCWPPRISRWPRRRGAEHVPLSLAVNWGHRSRRPAGTPPPRAACAIPSLAGWSIGACHRTPGGSRSLMYTRGNTACFSQCQRKPTSRRGPNNLKTGTTVRPSRQRPASFASE